MIAVMRTISSILDSFLRLGLFMKNLLLLECALILPNNEAEFKWTVEENLKLMRKLRVGLN